jgi:hypothetical protein
VLLYRHNGNKVVETKGKILVDPERGIGISEQDSESVPEWLQELTPEQRDNARIIAEEVDGQLRRHWKDRPGDERIDSPRRSKLPGTPGYRERVYSLLEYAAAEWMLGGKAHFRVMKRENGGPIDRTEVIVVTSINGTPTIAHNIHESFLNSMQGIMQREAEQRAEGLPPAE